MITYTEEQVIELIRENIALKKEKEETQEWLKGYDREMSDREAKAEQAEGKYADLASRCIELYVCERNIMTDTITVEVRAPRFMTQENLADAMFVHIKNLILQGRAEQFMKRGEYLE